MKILLVQALGYFVSYSGACKANRFLMEGLVRLGHECQVITVTPNDNGLRDHERFAGKLASGEVVRVHLEEHLEIYESNGVSIHTVQSYDYLEEYVQARVEALDPDWVLVTEDRVPSVLRAALRAAAGRVIEIAHSQVALPFGPESYECNDEHFELLRQTTGIVASSQYLSDYLLKWGQLESTVFPFPVHGLGPFEYYANFDDGFITMINPSEIKGLPIFIALAKHFPDLKFAAVPTWATTAKNLQLLEEMPNMTILPRVDDIDEIIKQTKILIVPSLWGEAFGAVIVDGMVRGVPVIASKVGGTPEAKLGVDYLLPVKPIVQYETAVDERLIPIPVIPEQDMGPWFDALARLALDRTHYEEISYKSKKAAEAFVNGIDLGWFINHLSTFLENASGVKKY
ncbi:glycosyltransferase [Paenibacillus sp. MMS18-CY102]|uniref:glycosyltransferase n=1 Tax=Paenibacillus sp. MMS18-CY102 TaxID=2682849 RepID=UPI001365A85E|nr:glycosyltransferase [Paenibacillus sp. MMS18-CY102]MWC30134.1 glycosyltransferase [Paenibacillus sp. MMS18-CY102]